MSSTALAEQIHHFQMALLHENHEFPIILGRLSPPHPRESHVQETSLSEKHLPYRELVGV